MAPKTSETIVLIPVQTQRISINIRGTAPVIFHKVSQRTTEKLDRKESDLPVHREAKDRDREADEGMYWLNDVRFGIVAEAFKKAIVRGAEQIGFTMTRIKQSLFVEGETSQRAEEIGDFRPIVPINGALVRRVDNVRIGRGALSVRHRYSAVDWTAVLQITFNSSLISASQVVDAVNSAGFGTGVGDWRPEKNGMFGRFEVVE